MVDDAGAVRREVGAEVPGGPEMGKSSGFWGGSGSSIQGQGCSHARQSKDKEWMPFTKLGHLVKDIKMKSLEEIYLFSLPIKESEIIGFFLGTSLKDEVLNTMPVRKQTHAGQSTRFKAFVATRDYNGQVGLGVKCSKEMVTAILGVMILAKLSIVPMRRVYWGNKIGKPHTIPCKMTGHCSSVLLTSSLCPGALALSQPLYSRN
ncbi:40S ribosomal protein S2 [Plecturocebus cupreus]